MAHRAAIRLRHCSFSLLSPDVWRSFSSDQTSDATRVDVVVEAFFDPFAHIGAVMS